LSDDRAKRTRRYSTPASRAVRGHLSATRDASGDDRPVRYWAKGRSRMVNNDVKRARAVVGWFVTPGSAPTTNLRMRSTSETAVPQTISTSSSARFTLFPHDLLRSISPTVDSRRPKRPRAPTGRQSSTVVPLGPGRRSLTRPKCRCWSRRMATPRRRRGLDPNARRGSRPSPHRPLIATVLSDNNRSRAALHTLGVRPRALDGPQTRLTS